MITKLKVEIEKSGYKQAHIASVLDIDYTLLSHYVRGEREAPDELLKKIAKFLKTSVDSLKGKVE